MDTGKKKGRKESGLFYFLLFILLRKLPASFYSFHFAVPVAGQGGSGF